MREIKPKIIKPIADSPTSRKIYPTLRIDLKNLPEAKKWNIGKTYKLYSEAELKGLVMDEFTNEATFNIKGIKVLSNKQTKETADKWLAKKLGK